MKFCTVCDNMYYIGISEKDGNQLTYYCRACGHTDETLGHENVCVLKTQLKKGAQNFHHVVNEYTKLDPTLPRIYTMKCPNTACKTNAEGDHAVPSEIIYIRYDEDNLKYLYMCSTCDTVWKTDDSH